MNDFAKDFNIEVFMSSKVNTYSYIQPSGGCIKCAMVKALGVEPRTAMSDADRGNYPLKLAFEHVNLFRDNYGLPLAKLMDDAESLLLIEGRLANPAPRTLMYENSIPVEVETKVKKFVLDGLVELNLIKTAELCEVK